MEDQSLELTVEITTKKKGRVIISDIERELKGTIIELPEEIKELTHYKQVLTLGKYKEEGSEVIYYHLLNTKPSKFCCKSMEQQFSFCDMHGLNCPDYFIRYRFGKYNIHALNAMYEISNCPFCGTNIKEN